MAIKNMLSNTNNTYTNMHKPIQATSQCLIRLMLNLDSGLSTMYFTINYLMRAGQTYQLALFGKNICHILTYG